MSIKISSTLHERALATLDELGTANRVNLRQRCMATALSLPLFDRDQHAWETEVGKWAERLLIHALTGEFPDAATGRDGASSVAPVSDDRMRRVIP